VNLPNYLTLSRIASVPLLIWFLSPHCQWFTIPGQREFVATTLFVIASITDGFDGYLARRRNQVTTLGMLLDPLADKLMVAGAFIALVQFNPVIVPAWVAVVVIGREFLVSGLRSIASSEGFTIEASDYGKFKMVTQIVAISLAIVGHYWIEVDLRWLTFHTEIVARTMMWIMVTISLISAFDYFAAFWKKIDHSAQKTRRRRPFVLTRKKRAQAAADTGPRS
jgi:CDP-diacylglycerol--glycerol-3-phosphate 3-phosphatidyltransferase